MIVGRRGFFGRAAVALGFAVAAPKLPVPSKPAFASKASAEVVSEELPVGLRGLSDDGTDGTAIIGVSIYNPSPAMRVEFGGAEYLIAGDSVRVPRRRR